MNEANFIVKWTVTNEDYSNDRQFVSRTYKDYSKEFYSFQESIEFIKQQKKEWDDKEIYNVLMLKDIKNHTLYEFRNALDVNMDKWLKDNGLDNKEW